MLHVSCILLRNENWTDWNKTGQCVIDTKRSHLHLSRIFVKLIYITAEVQMTWIYVIIGVTI